MSTTYLLHLDKFYGPYQCCTVLLVLSLRHAATQTSIHVIHASLVASFKWCRLPSGHIANFCV